MPQGQMHVSLAIYPDHPVTICGKLKTSLTLDPRADALRRMSASMVLSRKSDNPSVEIFESSARNEKILPNFDLLLPKFHFILPNFYFSLPWGIFVCSVEFFDFLGGHHM